VQCARCSGLQVLEVLRDGGTRTAALRCILCGDVIDGVIHYHRRLLARLPHPSRARPPTFGKTRWKERKTVLF
jgi:hypothetical protein